MHQVILDNIGIILTIIIAAQALILYGQSRIKEWANVMFFEICNFMRASNSIYTNHDEKIEKIEKKLK